MSHFPYLYGHEPVFNLIYSGYWCNSTFMQLQTSLRQNQVPHMWDLILAPAGLPPALLFVFKYCQYMTFLKLMRRLFKATISYPSIHWVKSWVQDDKTFLSQFQRCLSLNFWSLHFVSMFSFFIAHMCTDTYVPVPVIKMFTFYIGKVNYVHGENYFAKVCFLYNFRTKH